MNIEEKFPGVFTKEKNKQYSALFKKKAEACESAIESFYSDAEDHAIVWAHYEIKRLRDSLEGIASIRVTDLDASDIASSMQDEAISALQECPEK